MSNANRTETRSRSRYYAFRILFELEFNDNDIDAIVDNMDASLGYGAPPNKFAIALAKEVKTNKESLDKIISQYSTWDFSRIPLTDVVILRIAIHEILNRDDVATAISIDEAVKLAKVHSPEDSYKFINGMLRKISTDNSMPNSLVQE